MQLLFFLVLFNNFSLRAITIEPVDSKLLQSNKLSLWFEQAEKYVIAKTDSGRWNIKPATLYYSYYHSLCFGFSKLVLIFKYEEDGETAFNELKSGFTSQFPDVSVRHCNITNPTECCLGK